MLNNVCVTSWIESYDGRGWPPKLISRFEIQGHTVGLTANVSRADLEMAKLTSYPEEKQVKGREIVYISKLFHGIEDLELIEATGAIFLRLCCW